MQTIYETFKQQFYLKNFNFFYIKYAEILFLLKKIFLLRNKL